MRLFFITMLILAASSFQAAAQSDSAMADTTQATLLPSLRHLDINQYSSPTSAYNYDHEVRALFCRIEYRLRKSTGFDWNIGMDVK